VQTTMNKFPLAIILFILGLYFITHSPATYSSATMLPLATTSLGSSSIEGFEGTSASNSTQNDENKLKYRCADVLIQEGSNFFLYNSQLTKVPGVNPLRFNSLEEYVEFTEWQRSQGILCPILFLQQTMDAQNNFVYKARPSPTDLQGGNQDFTLGVNHAGSVTKLLDANRDNNIPYNVNSYPAFDPYNQDIGLDTPLDKMFHESNTQGVSPNPMDTNWAGHGYTNALVQSGYYSDNEVYTRR